MENSLLREERDSMRHILWVLILLSSLTGLLASEAFCEEKTLFGRVLSVNRDRGELRLETMSGGTQEEEITIAYDRDSSPPSLLPGDIVRIWGNFSESDPRHFTATHVGFGQVHNNGFHTGEDPTGVRSRIGRGRGMGRGSHEGRGSHGGGGRR